MARIKPQALLLQSKKKKVPTRVSLATIIVANIFVILFVLSVYATYRHWYNRSNDQPDDFERTEGTFEEQKKFDLPSYAVLDTAKGPITAELFKDSSPEVVDRFIDLCQKGHFKGMLFHRVIKNYVIQGGEQVGTAEDWTLKGKSHSQHTISPKHEAFMLGTAKAKPNTDNKGFELFITTAPIPDLSDKLIVFGRVIKGEDVVQEIEEVDTDEHYQPKSAIGIIDITLKHDP